MASWFQGLQRGTSGKLIFMLDAVNRRTNELESILGDIAAREKDLAIEADSLQDAKRAMRKELYQLGGEAKSTPLFLSVEKVRKRARGCV